MKEILNFNYTNIYSAELFLHSHNSRAVNFVHILGFGAVSRLQSHPDLIVESH